jgi:acyl transferase domain-containing protein/NADPH:quinone reductase-like Zn-dependent oxidoreductase/short-subunit dehydrogenase
MSSAGHSSTAALKQALRAVRELRAKLDASERARSEPLAIVGMGCRFPGGAASPQAFWQLLHEGVDAITEVPVDRWDGTALYHPDPTMPGRVSSRWGGFLDQVDQFDAGFFGISPREAAQMDPQQRLLLEVAWEALEDAGQTTDTLAGSATGVFVGVHSHSNDYTWLQYADPSQIDTYTGTGTSHSVVAGRLSYLLDLRGPAVALDTACSSSLVAVHLAGQALRNQECDVALAGGVNLALTPHFTMATSKMHLMAADGRCKTFDARADGFVRGEGCGAVVLKRLSDAARDGDTVLAVLRGSAFNQDGRTNGLTAPSGLSQQRIIQQALGIAGVDPVTVSAVEAHGTGTTLGDAIEIEALREVFDDPVGGGEPIALGSVKTNIGHLEAAAGVAGLIKMVLALRHEAVPPHLHLRRLNPDCELTGSRLVIPTELRPWPRGERPRRATVSSFGWSGTNACVVLEEAPAAASPPAPSTPDSDRRWELLPLSARSPLALRSLMESHCALLVGGTAPALADVCYTAAARRSHHPYRVAVTGRTGREVADRLAGLLAGGDPSLAVDAPVPAPLAGPVFVFSGQGAQWAQMGRALREQEPVFADMLRRCDELFRAHADWSLLAELDAERSRSRLDRTEIAQPALFAVEVALAELWRAWGVEPEAVVGHSVGEVAAAYVAGALSLPDAVRVAYHRGRVMQRAHGQGRMASVALPADEVGTEIAGYGEQLTIAAVNSQVATVVAGDHDAVAEMVARWEARGVATRTLPVEYAFHSRQMEPLRRPLVEALSDITPRPARIPIVSTVTGRPAAGEDFTAEYWGRNIREPVRFAAALAQRSGDDVAGFVEIGPQPVLARPVTEHLDRAGRAGVVVASMRSGAEPRATLLHAVGSLYRAGYRVDWRRLHPVAGRHVALPAYPWQRERHWLARPPGALATPTWAVAPARHPLLGRLIRSALPTYENELPAGATGYLIDHRIHGAALLPMSGYVELALAAYDGPATRSVTDLVLREPMPLADDARRSVQLVLTPQPDGTTTFQIHSAPAADRDHPAWTRHAAGGLAPGTPAPAGDRWDLAAIAARMQPVEVTPFYQRLRTAGLAYGPAFTGIGRLWRGDQEALGEITLPADLAAAHPEHRWHPAQLDACLQVVLAALPDRAAGQLPIGLDRFATYTAPGTRVFSHARIREHGDEATVADVEMRTDRGELAARAEGLLLTRTTQRVAGRPAADLHYRLTWEQVPVGAPAAAGTGGWLFVGEHADVASQLGELLRAQGAQVEQVSTGELADLPRLLDAGSWWCGIVYLAGLAGAGEPDEPSLDQILSAHARAVTDLLALTRALADGAPPAPRLWLLTRGTHVVAGEPTGALTQAPVLGLAKAIASELPELRCTSVDLDPGADLAQLSTLHRLLLAAGEEDQLAIRDGRAYGARLVPAAEAASGHQPATDGPVRLAVAERGTLRGLRLRASPRRPPAPGEVEIRVRATGLNFRDVLNALGMYPGDAGPLGLECAGEVTAVGPGVPDLTVGQRVLAFAPASFGTYTTVTAPRVVPLPDQLSYREAATIPVAFLTASYGLHHLAQLRPGDRVLIHAAAGGVGLAAVQLAQQAGAEVFATASPGKWPRLAERGVAHIFHSRTLDFADAIRPATGGEGVDVVLNSLTDEFIPASLDLLRPGGRFIEIGKRGIWDHDQVARHRPDVSYHRFDLGEVADDDPALIRAMLSELTAMVTDGRLSPLPVRDFPLARAEAAFRVMAQARHVGKIVVVQPDGPPVREDATYLITGGLGAMGLATARTLVAHGARHLVLLGRRAPAGEAADAVADLRSTAQVVTRQVDVADPQALAGVLADITATMPPLRGVVHAAGVLDDGILPQQTWQRFAAVLAPKVAGGWSLHLLTRAQPLDFFVLYSSVASLLGSAGQGSYVTANTFLDALAHHRHARGLPATSVNWGPWAEAGMAAGLSDQQRQRLASRGLRPLTTAQGTEALHRIIETGPVQVGVVAADWSAVPHRSDGSLPPLLARLHRPAPAGAGQPAAGKAAHGVRERVLAAPPSERRRLLQDYVQAQVVRILGLPPAQPPGPQQPLRELGLDSLMAIELRNALGQLAGRSLPSTIAFDHPTVARLTRYLLGELFPPEATPATPAAPAPAGDPPADQREIVARVAHLDDDAVAELLAAKLSTLDPGGAHD